MFGPALWCQFADLPVGGRRQPGEDVAQIGLGIKPATTTALDDGIEDGGVLTCFSFADKQPILFAERGGADGVLDEVLVDLDTAIVEIDAQKWPKV